MRDDANQNEVTFVAICSTYFGQLNACVLIVWGYDRRGLLLSHCLLVFAPL
jgi:hypothetical protein